jgi:peptidoglycan/LPS O-acetylase OafA/YrhL
LDVLRSLAILLVFSEHMGAQFNAPGWFGKLFTFGWTGVDLFFVLSGLLIGGQLWKELQRTGHIQIGRFILRRGLRIWPLYYSFVGLILVQVLFAGRRGAGLWADALFVSNYFPNQIGGGWSLSTEEQFYVLAPLSLSILALKIVPRHLWLLPISGLLIPIITRATILASAHLTAADLGPRLNAPFHTHMDGLAAGMLLAWFAAFLPDLVRSRWFRWSAACAAFVTAAGLYISNHVLFSFTALALIYGAVTFCCMSMATTSRILNWHGFYLISRLSYGVYLNHLGVLSRVQAVLGPFRQQHGQGAFLLCYLLSLLASLAVAAITFQLIEWPFLQIRSRWQRLATRRPASSRNELAQVGPLEKGSRPEEGRA